MSTLKIAIELAHTAHKEQKRFDGSPYILHLFRVMGKQKTEVTRIIAMLHDIVEDTPVTIYDLQNSGFSKEVTDAIELMTHDNTIDYDVYIQRLSVNRNAILVKMADLEDNLNMLEIPNLKSKDLERLVKYHRNWWKLKAELEK
jgi:(p)ppGpp synthase/HD superfamily hydrolase